MLHTVVQKNNYQDSINLMLLSNSINELDGVVKGQVMMATDANKDIFKAGGLYTEELEAASPNDLAIVVDTDDEAVVEKVVEEVDRFLSDLSSKKESSDGPQAVDNWKDALDEMPDANLALISVPGIYAADEIETALDNNLHVFSFSDNVTVEDEVRLKAIAREKGLMLMGPDCGTGLISSIPLAFTNVINPGNIGVVGASGTGIQEVTTIIDHLGGGVVHAIGTGGRDLSESVDAVTMLDAISGLEHHEFTDVIVVISKPPAEAVKNKVIETLQSLSKPVVAIFLGEKPMEHIGNVYFAYTLEETAQIAVDLANGNEIKANYYEPITYEVEKLMTDKTVKGLYSGGTLASEAATLVADALDLGDIQNEDGYILNEKGFEIVDLGDDVYTQGRPHPMIDPDVRIEKIHEVYEDETTGVVLLDIVLGYGAHADMVGALEPALTEVLNKAKEDARDFKIIASVVGTTNDPQNYTDSIKRLEEMGVIVESSNARAIRLALKMMGVEPELNNKELVAYDKERVDIQEPSEKVFELLNEQLKVINIGIESFTEPINNFGGEVVQFDWRPKAGGNQKLIKILNAMDRMPEIDVANEKVVARLKESQPHLIDVKPAYELIPELNTDEKIILHAGPPMEFENVTGPALGAMIGALKFEGWAKDDEDAQRQLENGEVRFIPCHHVGAVGPMGGITTKNFPMLAIENKTDGTTGYCIMNEGIGTVLRFGANGPDVIRRLEWQRDVLGPVLSKALATFEEGLNVNSIISQAITMGDEFHQRNIAASALFLREISPAITSLTDVSDNEKQESIQFLADTDQFFLNIAMATGKAIVDYARKIEEGTIITTMSRNGYEFGVRIAGMGDEWFTAPVNTPKGLYFTGYTEEDGNPDIGDSAITETIGLGGVAMIAAPGVTRFVGSGGFQDALDTSNRMEKIFIDNNSTWSIPTWDFKGALIGLDARKVVETGIEPIINTGIAHKKAGVGQVGAGTVTAPVQAFEKALVAYAKKLGLDIE